MDATTETGRAGTLGAFLAGLQSGMLGVLCMLAWLGVSAMWQRRSFWTAANLLASAFYGDAAIRRGFAFSTVAGIALYVLIYSLLGGVFATAVAGRFAAGRTLLLGILLGLSWYYLSFHVIWKRLLPLVWLLHAGRATAIGHLLYGAFCGRFPVYLQRQAAHADAPGPAAQSEAARH